MNAEYADLIRILRVSAQQRELHRTSTTACLIRSRRHVYVT